MERGKVHRTVGARRGSPAQAKDLYSSRCEVHLVLSIDMGSSGSLAWRASLGRCAGHYKPAAGSHLTWTPTLGGVRLPPEIGVSER
jgi:hypothetical protein